MIILNIGADRVNSLDLTDQEQCLLPVKFLYYLLLINERDFQGQAQ